MQKIKFTPSYDDDADIVEADIAIDIIGDDGRPLFTIKQLECGGIEVSSTGFTVKHNDEILDSGLSVMPRASNVMVVSRVKYER